MSTGLIAAGIALGGFLAGVGVAALLGALRRQSHTRTLEDSDPLFADVRGSGKSGVNGVELPAPISPRMVALLGRAIREPLKELRRTEGCPPDALARLEHIAWQTRMIVAHPRPMQSKLVSPIAILQEASESVPALRDGLVGISWSLMNRQPVEVDPERAQAAFRELLTAGAAMCGERGRLAIRILSGVSTGYPVRIEIEIGRPGAEADPLAFLVARHLLESQGGRVEIDGRISRVHLRSTPPEAKLPPGLRP